MPGPTVTTGAAQNLSFIIPAAVLFIGQILTLLGIFVTYQRNKRLFLFQKAQELELQRHAAQISEFYAPLHMLLRKGEVAYSVFSHLHTEEKSIEAGKLFKDVLISNNDQIISIILAKSHLLDPTDDIKTYVAFVIHAELLKLNASKGEFKIQHETVAFPRDLPRKVEIRYHELRDSYLKQLRQQR